MIVVSDTSPLRGLQALGKTEVLRALYGEVLIPPAVHRELLHDVARMGAFAIEALPWLRVVAPRDQDLVHRLMRVADAGESEAIALCKEFPQALLLIDESVGRRQARQMGLEIQGLLAVLVDAKRAGLISAVKPLIALLNERIDFRVSDQVTAIILESAGEV